MSVQYMTAKCWTATSFVPVLKNGILYNSEAGLCFAILSKVEIIWCAFLGWEALDALHVPKKHLIIVLHFRMNRISGHLDPIRFSVQK